FISSNFQRLIDCGFKTMICLIKTDQWLSVSTPVLSKAIGKSGSKDMALKFRETVDSNKETFIEGLVINGHIALLEEYGALNPHHSDDDIPLARVIRYCGRHAQLSVLEKIFESRSL